MRIKLFTLAVLLSITSNISFAQEASSSNIELMPDADRPAYLWAQANPTGVAVSVHLGRDTTVAAERIEAVLRQDFAESGIANVRFFFEDSGPGNSSLAFLTRNHVFGPFRLSEARNQVGETARQLRFEIERGLN